MPLQTVNAGDLITSSDWNAMVAAVNDLQTRLDLMSPGASAISLAFEDYSRSPAVGETTDYYFTLTSAATTELSVTISPHPSLVTGSLPLAVRSVVPTNALLQLITVREASGSAQRVPGSFNLGARESKTIIVSLAIPSTLNISTSIGTLNLSEHLTGVRFDLNVEAGAPGVPTVTRALPTQVIS